MWLLHRTLECKTALCRLLSHWQHENVDDEALELLEESNMIKLRLTAEQARIAFCFIQVKRPFALPQHMAGHCSLIPLVFHKQRRSLQQQVNMLSQENNRLEQELEEAQERGDSAMLQVNAACRACAQTALLIAWTQVSQTRSECAQVKQNHAFILQLAILTQSDHTGAAKTG